LGQTIINYKYDPLYRLKEANYSNNDYYHYAYDAVGNRLSQNTLLGGLTSTTSYLYDNANRVQTVNGMTYTFDANGNTSTSSVQRLLNDGVNAYTYDSANPRFPVCMACRFMSMRNGSVHMSSKKFSRKWKSAC
jgi:YD repeat-containing protein